MKKLFVGNLSWKATEDLLRQEFEQYGAVVSVKIITDPYTGKSKGFGFVEMDSPEAAQKAIKETNDKMLLDRNLRVSLAQERSERREFTPGGPRGAPRGGQGGGDRGGFGGGRPRREKEY